MENVNNKVSEKVAPNGCTFISCGITDNEGTKNLKGEYTFSYLQNELLVKNKAGQSFNEGYDKHWFFIKYKDVNGEYEYTGRYDVGCEEKSFIEHIVEYIKWAVKENGQPKDQANSFINMLIYQLTKELKEVLKID